MAMNDAVHASRILRVPSKVAWAPIREIRRKWMAVRGKLARMHWTSFRLGFFAPFGDVTFKERVARILYLVWMQGNYAKKRA